MASFKEAVDACGFIDVPFSGYEFTYDNGRELEENIQCRLDRALATLTWRELFPDGHLWHLDREWSDHAPSKLTFWKPRIEPRLGPKPFRFEQYWTSEGECEGVIENAWLGGATLPAKLELCAADLKE